MEVLEGRRARCLLGVVQRGGRLEYMLHLPPLLLDISRKLVYLVINGFTLRDLRIELWFILDS